MAAFLTWTLLLSSLAAPAPQTPSGHVERQVVALAEISILVTDRKGRAIRDLASREVHVFEDGVEQRVAFVESVYGERETGSARSPERGVAVDTGASILLPARPVRRIVLAFDATNSSVRVRRRWKASALKWLTNEMQPTDVVGIFVFGNPPGWVARPGHDAATLTAALEELDLDGAAGHQNRQSDMSALMNEIQDYCPLTGDSTGLQCAINLSRSYVRLWNLQSETSVRNLQTLVEQLAELPGREAVLLFSDGIVGDPSAMAVNALLSIFGPHHVNVESMRWRFGQDAHHELKEMQQAARSAGVTFFTLYTRTGDATGFGGNLEQAEARQPVDLGVDPWQRMESSTRQTLAVVAEETGGRSYTGLSKLDRNLEQAANGFFGIYTVGYYRSDPEAERDKLRVTVDRRRVRVDHAPQASF